MTLSDQLIAAIHSSTLARDVRSTVAASPADRQLVEAASAALASIGADGVAAFGALSSALGAAGVAHEPLMPPEPLAQRIALDISVAEADASTAVSVAENLGYRPWYRLRGGAWEAYRRCYPSLPLIAETASGHPILVEMRWRTGAAASGLGARLRPRPQEMERLRLPHRLWFGHLAWGPLDRVGSRVLGRPRPREFGPFLPTPIGLIDALLDLAEVGSDDVVVDLGCGDGRLLVHAASTRGCRAIGVDRDAELVGRANAAAEAASVGGLVTASVGEIAGFEVSEATVVVLFLSAASLPDVVGDLQRQLPSGARIVAHEQAPLPIRADRSVPLLAPAGITVAHRWDVP